MQEPAKPSDKQQQAQDDQQTVKLWLEEIKLSKAEIAKWEKRSDRIVKRYRDERSTESDIGKRYNLFWSGVQTLQPALYARTPKPQVERRFKDQDPIGRLSAQILERATNYLVNCGSGFDVVMRQCRDDYLLVGRGTAWVRYVPSFDEAGNVVSETVKTDYVFWKDFFHSPARYWDEVRWVGRRVYMRKEEGVERFGEAFKNVKLDYIPEQLKDNTSEIDKTQESFRRAVVYEIWDKPTKKVYWIADGLKSAPLDAKEDPLGLHDFFPCARPLYATLTNETLIPVADFTQAQDIANSIDNLTNRIDVITNAIMVRGVYDASTPEVSKLLTKTGETGLVPVANWAMFAQAGGLKGVMDFMPIDMLIQAVKVLFDAREQEKQSYFEITGLSDIVRGQGNPNETATAQQIKGQFATLRLEDRQKEVQRFARDLIAIQAEIVAEHFSPESLFNISGAQSIEGANEETFPQAIELLKNDLIRNYRIDIETDSTIAVDEQADKQARVEFLTSFGQFLQNFLQIGANMPALMPLAQEMILFTLRGFSVGRGLEASVENAFVQMKQEQEQQAQQPPPPDPEELKMQMEAQAQELKRQEAQQKIELEWQKFQQELELEVQKMQQQAQDTQATLAFESEKIKQHLALEVAKMEKDTQLKTQELLVNSQMTKAQIKSNHILKATANWPPEHFDYLKDGEPKKTKKLVRFSMDENGSKTAEITEVPDNGAPGVDTSDPVDTGVYFDYLKDKAPRKTKKVVKFNTDENGSRTAEITEE